MITKWGVKNFKSILDADLELAPLTIFTGVNSSGKSSFLQSIVMLAQAARSDDNEGKIPLKGDLIDFCIFERIYHNKASEHKKRLIQEHIFKKIGVNFTIPAKENEDINIELGLNSIKNKENEEFLYAAQGLIENNKKEENKKISLKWTDISNFTFEGSNLYDEIWKKSISDGENTIQTDKLEVSNDYLDYGHSVDFKHDLDTEHSFFIPIKLCYKPCDLHSDLWDKSIDIFINLLADIPSEIITKEDAKKYTENKLKEELNRHLPPFRNVLYDFLKTLFYLCANYLWWMYNKKDKKSDKRPALFKKLSFFDEKFSGFRNLYDSGSEYYKIEFSDWYQILSMQDKNTKDIIKKELKNEAGFIKSLRNNIADFKKEINYLYFPMLIKTRNYLIDYFKYQIKYLGPLRDTPKEEYPEDKDNKAYYEETYHHFSKDGLKKDSKLIIDVGVKGEYTMTVIKHLLRNNNEIRNYYSPEFYVDPNYNMFEDKKEEIFSRGLTEWLNYFELCDKFENKDAKEDKNRDLEKDSFISFKMRIDGQEYTLPQLGTGVSQILPILVICLSADENSTLIIQEPEQNLHPKLQSRLADFFIAMSLSGRQCLIETHSEYIIEQIRYRVIMLSRRTPSISLHEKTKFYFVTKRDGISYYKDIGINEYGVSDEWPDDFFDETPKILDRTFEEDTKKKETQGQNE
jgi:predicted ATPase